MYIFEPSSNNERTFPCLKVFATIQFVKDNIILTILNYLLIFYSEYIISRFPCHIWSLWSILCWIGDIIRHFTSTLAVMLNLRPSRTDRAGVKPRQHVQRKHRTSVDLMWRHYQSGGGLPYILNFIYIVNRKCQLTRTGKQAINVKQ